MHVASADGIRAHFCGTRPELLKSKELRIVSMQH